jgi:penicillin-binding protein 2
MNSFFERRYIVAGIFIAFILVLLGRLFYIQVVDDRYALYASQNVVRKMIQYPARGPILDRNGKIMVQNEPVYDIMVIPKQVTAFDTVEFCKLLGIDREGYDKRMALKPANIRPTAPRFSRNNFGTVIRVVPGTAFGVPGLFPAATARCALTPIHQRRNFWVILARLPTLLSNAREGIIVRATMLAYTGVERSYETVLRGQRGVQNWMVDSRNVPKGRMPMAPLIPAP